MECVWNYGGDKQIEKSIHDFGGSDQLEMSAFDKQSENSARVVVIPSTQLLAFQPRDGRHRGPWLLN